VLLSDAARTRLENATRARLQAVLQEQGVGIGVTSVSVNEVQLPDPVQAAEQQAQRASEDHRHALDQARGDADGVRAAAHQAAQRQISDAQIYATRTLADAQAEADRFNALLPAYRAAPAITREHLYIATLTDILAHAHKLFVDVRPGSGINLPAGALAAALGEGTGIERISGAAPGVSGPQQATTMQPTAASPDTGASSTPAAAGPGSGGDRGLDLERSRSREAR
jgi:membrane protease subunit HflK